MTSNTASQALARVFKNSGLSATDQTALVSATKKIPSADPLLSVADTVKSMSKAVPGPITEIPAEGLWITQGGTYTFAPPKPGQPLCWTPTLLARAAIVITADDVVLDFGGTELKVELGAEDISTAAVLVLGGTNVTVRDGTIVNAGYRGVWSQGTTGLTVENLTVSGMTYKNLAQRGMCPAGIFVQGGIGATLTGCTVQYGYVTADVTAGIMFVETIGAKITGCHVTDLTNYDGSVQGFCSYLSVDLAWDDCHALRLQSFFNGNIRTGGHTVLGFMPCLSAGLTVTGCSARHIIGSRDDCHGMSIFICADATAKGFVAQTVVDGPAPYLTGAKATGLEVYGWGVTVTDCQVSDIRATCPQDRQSAGFSAWGTDISFTGCHATGVHVFNAGGAPDTAHGFGVGYGWAPDPRPMFCHTVAKSVTYEGCSASDCQVGFDSWNHVDSTWSQVTASACGIAVLEPDAQPGPRTLFADPASECNPPITITLQDQASGNTFPANVMVGTAAALAAE